MVWSSLKVSILVVSIATVFITIVGTSIGLLLAKGRFYGKDLLDSIVTMPLVLPPTVVGYCLILLLGKRGLLGQYIFYWTGWTITFTWQGAVIASTVLAIPLMIKSARAAIESVDPLYETASYTLGKGSIETLFRITLPLAKRGIIAGIVLSFARALGEFGATLMLAGNIQGETQTMPLAIYEAVMAGEEKQAQIIALILTVISVLSVYLTNKLSSVSQSK
jgi:molybdate transport system permease protein